MAAGMRYILLLFGVSEDLAYLSPSLRERERERMLLPETQAYFPQ